MHPEQRFRRDHGNSRSTTSIHAQEGATETKTKFKSELIDDSFQNGNRQARLPQKFFESHK